MLSCWSPEQFFKILILKCANHILKEFFNYAIILKQLFASLVVMVNICQDKVKVRHSE